jgi:hypothetical protein
MQRCRLIDQSSKFSSVLALLLVPAGMLHADEPGGKRTAVPDQAAQKKVEGLIRELFQEEYAKAQKDSQARARLAATLLQEGKDTADNIPGRYVLFREARELAASAGDAPTALQAIEELAAEFTVPASELLQLRVKALTLAAKATATPDAYQTVVDASLVLLEDALEADDFETASTLVSTAEAAARKLKIVSLVSAVRKRQSDVEQQRKVFDQWRPFAEKLLKNPKDAEANLEMGKYYAFRKGNWDKGLALLTHGTDAELKALAAQDLKQPTEALARAKLAQGWLFASTQAPEPARIQIALRAYHWFQQALPDLDEATRVRVEKQMQAIMDKLPAEYRVGEIAAEIRRLEGHHGPVFGVAFSPDGKKAVSGSADGSLRVWDTKGGKEVRRLDGHSGRVWAVAFAPDGRRVLSGGFDGSVRLWDLASGREIRRFPGHSDYVRSVTFSHDGRHVLSGGDDRLVRLWDTDSGKELQTFTGHDHFVWSVALSRDGTHALSGSLDKTVRLWDVKTGKEVKRFTGHKDTVLSVAFSPNGRWVLSGSTDKTLRLWDIESAKELRTLTGHTGYVNDVAFSPDGRRALSAGQDQTVRLWDVLSGKELRKLDGHRDQVWSVSFSRDGRWAASAGNDSTVRVWGGAR